MQSRASAAAALAARRRAYAVQLRSMRRTFQQIADAVLPCPEHVAQGGIDPRKCAELHELQRMAADDPRTISTVDCASMYANRKGAQRAVEQGLAEQYHLSEADRDELRREWLATIDTAVQRIMRDVVGGADAGDRARAANALVRLADRAAKLTGLDAPTRITVTDELDEQIAGALAELAELPMPTDEQMRS